MSLAQVEGRAGKGDRRAARYLISRLSRLDGGELEDALVAMGQFSDRRMRDFLLFYKKGQLAKIELEDAVSVVPLSLGDDLCAHMALLRSRQHKLNLIRSADLAEPKRRALQAISQSLSEVKAAMDVEPGCHKVRGAARLTD
jgi:hypothetical protein